MEDEAEAWEWLTRRYPAVAEWLEPFTAKGRKRYDKGEFWWELRACDYYDEFEKPKIYYPDISLIPSFILDTNNFYAANTAYFIPKGELPLLGVLNSKVVAFFLKISSNAIRGGYIRYFTQTVETIPLPPKFSEELTTEVQKIIKIVKESQEVKSDFSDYLTHALGIEKPSKKLRSPERLTLDELAAELKKKKIDLNDFSIFKSIKTLHDRLQSLQAEINATDRRIDAEVYRLYGLSGEEIALLEAEL